MIYLLYVLAAVVTLVIFTLVAAALRPSEFAISRSISIDAGPARIFPYLNSLHQFQEWNPYKDKDPRCRNTFSGPATGPGASFHWDGDAQVGEGIMTIRDTLPERRVSVDLEFRRPFPGMNSVEFSLAPQEAETLVTWSMKGRYAFVPKLVGLFINMDKMIGGDFENGLKKLKEIVEAKGNLTRP